MRLILLFVSSSIIGAMALRTKTEKIAALKKELADDLRSAVLNELYKLINNGHRFPKAEAFNVLRTITISETKKLTKKIRRLARYLEDPDNPKLAREVTIELKDIEVKNAYRAIIEGVDEDLAGRSDAAINKDMAVLTRSANNYITKMLSSKEQSKVP